MSNNSFKTCCTAWRNAPMLLVRLGIIALIVIIGFEMTGCKDPVSDSELDTAALTNKIEEAQGERDNTIVAANPAEVPEGQKWVTQDAMNALNIAIAEAEAALASAKTQTAVGLAVTALDNALTDFRNAQETGRALNLIVFVAVTGIHVPVFDAVANNSCSCGVENVSIVDVSWNPWVNGAFAPLTEYTVIVTLRAADGYIFVNSLSATINGEAAEVTGNTGGRATLSYTFPKTLDKLVTDIEVKTQPKLAYIHGEKLDLTELVVMITYDNTLYNTDDVAFENFAEYGITTVPAYEDTLSIAAHNGRSIEIRYGELTAYTDNLTVNKANPEVTWPEGLKAGYGQTLADISLAAYTNGGAGVFAWTEDGTTPVGSALGMHLHDITFTPNDTEHYNPLTSSVNIEVTLGIITTTDEWEAALAYLNGKAGEYTLVISGDIGVSGVSNLRDASSFGTTPTESALNVSLQGSGKLYLKSQGNIVHVGELQTLVIDSEDLTLEGLSDGAHGATQNNNAALVQVNNGGMLELRNGTITGNTNTFTYYNETGGVQVNRGTFIMQGGTISGNTGGNGGGVQVYAGTFIMQSGTISGNAGDHGGGVYVAVGTFIMQDGTISGNAGGYGGGGVCVVVGTFIMQDGTISDNTSSARSNIESPRGGGGVSIDEHSTFEMHGGEISGNTVNPSTGGAHGGGVFVGRDSSLVMGGEAKISGNTTIISVGNDYGGGGVYVGPNATLTMNGGEISGNTAICSNYSHGSGTGGGVLMYENATLTMNGGKISGNKTYSMWDGTILPDSSTGGGVRAWSDVTITMYNGASISDNEGGGVYMRSGTFTMQDGEISGNSYGGGVSVVGSDDSSVVLNAGATISDNTGAGVSVGGIGGNSTIEMNAGVTISDNRMGVSIGETTFTMNGGKISGNINTHSRGSGVYVNGGTFIMQGGEISGNIIYSDTHAIGENYGGGGGVYLSDGTFTMYAGAVISGNTIYGSDNYYSDGGGVLMISGTFTMHGGEISDNTANGSYGGGGVFMREGTFTMYAGSVISGNTVSDGIGGGGVCVYGGTFIMQGGTISGNTINTSDTIHATGGGVFVFGTFRMVTGTIYGSNATAPYRNTAREGAALDVVGYAVAQHGFFNDTNWSVSSNLNTSEITIQF